MKIVQLFGMMCAADAFTMLPGPVARGPRIQAAARSQQRMLSRRFEKPDAEVAEELRRQAQQLREEAERLEASMQAERSAELEQELDRFFEVADSNKDGVVSLEELRVALRKTLVEDNENTRAASKAARLLDSEERVLAILKELDVNADGVLSREEMIPVRDFQSKLEAQFRESQAAQLRKVREADVDTSAAERLAAFESVANKTAPLTRLGAIVCYTLPLLDAIPIDALLNRFEPNALTSLLVGAYATYHALPGSGLIIFLILSGAAANAAAPRLTRFAARHAIILDLVAALLLPLVYRFAGAPTDIAVAGVFELLVLTCIVAAGFGSNADFVPGSGTLTKRFTDDFESGIKNFITNATAAEFGMIISVMKGEEPEEEEMKNNDDQDKKN